MIPEYANNKSSKAKLHNIAAARHLSKTRKEKKTCLIGALHKMLKIGTFWTPSSPVLFLYRENGNFYVGCLLLV